MKKLICILLCAVLFCAAPAQADSTDPTGTTEITLEILRDDSVMLFLSPEFSGVAISLSEMDTETVPQDLLDVLLALKPEQLVSAAHRFAGVITTWMMTHQFVREEKGLFTGDAFLKARIKKEFTVRNDELPSLLGMLTDPERSIAEMYLSRTGGQGSLNGAVYDGGKFFSVNLMSGGNCVMTLSADVSEPDESYLVFGFGNGSSFYYHEADFRKDGEQIVFDMNLYSGTDPYFSARDQALCQTIHLVFAPKGENVLSFSGEADAVPLSGPIRFSGTLNDCFRVKEPEDRIRVGMSSLIELIGTAMLILPSLDLLELINAFGTV